MKRQRTGSFAFARRQPTLPTLAAAPATGVNRRLTKEERKQVKNMIEKAAPKSIVHNSHVGGLPISGVLAGPITSLLSFGAIDQGLSESQRRGDQIWITKIHFKCTLVCTASEDIVRIMVARSKATAGPPTAISWADVLQNAGTGINSIVSTVQDDCPYTILHDKLYKCGNKTAYWGTAVVDFTLDYSKRPLKVVYYDGTAAGGVSNMVIGNIELAAATILGTGVTTMTYVYDVEFTEK